MDAILADTAPSTKQIKLIVWDLDLTLWDGILMEDPSPVPFDGIIDTIKKIDSLGILQSIASRNDLQTAVAHLKKIGIEEYFLYPQISWGSKSAGIVAVTNRLNIGLDTVLFVDDQDYELAEVTHTYPQVRTLHANQAGNLFELPHIRPSKLTSAGERRRLMYQEDAARSLSEQESAGPPELFLASLNLEITISPATLRDIDRAEELIERTNQLNSTGVLFSREEISQFAESESKKLLIVSLRDRFGDYGQIGLALLDIEADEWILQILLVSCRVLSRGVGPILLNHLSLQAKRQNARLKVLFRDTGKNRPMRIALMMTGFIKDTLMGDTEILHHPETYVPRIPAYIKIRH